MARYKNKVLLKGNELHASLKPHFEKMHEARLKFMVLYILALIQAQTVDSSHLANVMQNEVEAESNQRRIERFFQSYELDFQEFACAIVGLLGEKGKLGLIIDRTNWKFGSVHINILTLSIGMEGMSIPIFFGCWIIAATQTKS